MTGRPNFLISMLAGLVLFAGILSGCSGDDPGKDPSIIAKINKYTLTRDEFNTRLAREIEFNQEYKATTKARKEFLNSLIKKEVLIQEAVARKLNKNKEFIRAIEKYWEATLIRTLMESEMAEISQRTLVTETELKKRYNVLKEGQPELAPLEAVEKELAEAIKAEKQTAMVDEWVQALIEKADINIFDKDLKN